MKFSTLLCVMLCALYPLANTFCQEEVWSQTYESREEFFNLIQLSTDNYLISGKTHELGNKSDFVILTDTRGMELKRQILCSSCQSGHVVQSLENAVGEILHFRSNGDLYSSDLDLNETKFEFNISEDKFESIETYEVLKYNHFLVAVSYAVKDDVKGLLHTVMDSRDKRIYNQKFNVEFPDISGSIGIGIFDDQGVIDGYNTEEAGKSTGHLVRLGRYRDVVWEVDLDFGDIVLEHPLVAKSENVYAVGNIVDENTENHLQGLLVKYDPDGNLLFSKQFDAEEKDNPAYDVATLNFTNIEQLTVNDFVITGYEGGLADGEPVTSALVMVVDSLGELKNKYNSSLLTTTVTASDVVLNNNNDLVYIAKAFKNNGIDGSYIAGIIQTTSAVSDLVSLNTDMVFPNPASDRLYINEAFGSGNFEIINMDGKLILNGEINSVIDISEINSGMYMIKLNQQDKSTSVLKFFKN